MLSKGSVAGLGRWGSAELSGVIRLQQTSLAGWHVAALGRKEGVPRLTLEQTDASLKPFPQTVANSKQEVWSQTASGEVAASRKDAALVCWCSLKTFFI